MTSKVISKTPVVKFKKKAIVDEDVFNSELDLIREAITGIPSSTMSAMDAAKGLSPLLKNGRRKISRRKPGTKSVANYFDEKTQAGIVSYQKEPDVEKKKKIYVIEILPAFDALVENLINVYGFAVIHETKQDLKSECLEFLYGAVNKFNPEKGSKAFSYFNVVAKNWLTIKSKQNAKKVQSYISIDNRDDISKEDLELIENYQILASYDEVTTAAEVQAQLVKLIATIESRVKTDNEISCMKAVKTLMENIENVDLLSKRAVLLYIREITGLSSKQLSIVLSSLKKHYKELKKLEEFQS